MKEKKYSRKHIGKTFKTKESLGGYEGVVVDGGSRSGHCTIQIKDWVKEVQYRNTQMGNIKYPYHPSVAGVGFLGESYSTKGRAYAIWGLMMLRCYDVSAHARLPSYSDVTICDEWHNFSVFSLWYHRYYPRNGLNYHIDKDLLDSSSREYGPLSCLFISPSLNVFMTNHKSSNTSGHIGVVWDKPKRKWVAKIGINWKTYYLGHFEDIKEAAEAYRIARAEQVRIKQAYHSFDYPKHVLDRLK